MELTSEQSERQEDSSHSDNRFPSRTERELVTRLISLEENTSVITDEIQSVKIETTRMSQRIDCMQREFRELLRRIPANQVQGMCTYWQMFGYL